MTRTAFEAALDAGLLETKGFVRNNSAFSNSERWYRVRRNGRTRTWKRSPERFEIPIKFRFRDTSLVTDREFNNGAIDFWFRIIKESDQ